MMHSLKYEFRDMLLRVPVYIDSFLQSAIIHDEISHKDSVV